MLHPILHFCLWSLQSDYLSSIHIDTRLAIAATFSCQVSKSIKVFERVLIEFSKAIFFSRHDNLGSLLHLHRYCNGYCILPWTRIDSFIPSPFQHSPG